MPTFDTPLNGVSLSDALKEAATYAPIDRVVLATYEFVHPSFMQRALIVNDYQNLTAVTEVGDTVTYIGVAALRVQGFDESDQASTPTLKLSIDGVSLDLVDKLDAAVESMVPVQVIERIYVSDQLTGPAILPPAKVYIRDGTFTETRIEIECGLGDSANLPFPRKNYTREEHPSLSA